MVELVRQMDVPPAGLVSNRDMPNDGAAERDYAQVQLPVLTRIPLDRQIGEALAAGECPGDGVARLCRPVPPVAFANTETHAGRRWVKQMVVLGGKGGTGDRGCLETRVGQAR